MIEWWWNDETKWKAIKLFCVWTCADVRLSAMFRPGFNHNHTHTDTPTAFSRPLLLCCVFLFVRIGMESIDIHASGQQYRHVASKYECIYIPDIRYVVHSSSSKCFNNWQFIKQTLLSMHAAANARRDFYVRDKTEIFPATFCYQLEHICIRCAPRWIKINVFGLLNKSFIWKLLFLNIHW